MGAVKGMFACAGGHRWPATTFALPGAKCAVWAQTTLTSQGLRPLISLAGVRCRRGIHRDKFLVSNHTGASDEHLLRTP
jgi:hypothetical protein